MKEPVPGVCLCSQLSCFLALSQVVHELMACTRHDAQQRLGKLKGDLPLSQTANAMGHMKQTETSEVEVLKLT